MATNYFYQTGNFLSIPIEVPASQVVFTSENPSDYGPSRTISVGSGGTTQVQGSYIGATRTETTSQGSVIQAPIPDAGPQLANGTPLQSYDSTKYPSAADYLLDHLTGYAGLYGGLDAWIQALQLNPDWCLAALQQYAQITPLGDQGNYLQWLGSPMALLQAIGIGANSLGGQYAGMQAIIAPVVSANLAQLNAGQQQTAAEWVSNHPAQSMTLTDYLVDVVLPVAAIAAPAIIGAIGAAGAGGTLTSVTIPGEVVGTSIGADTAALTVPGTLTVTVAPDLTTTVIGASSDITTTSGLAASTTESVLTQTIPNTAGVAIGEPVQVSIDSANLTASVAPTPEDPPLQDPLTDPPAPNQAIVQGQVVSTDAPVAPGAVPDTNVVTPTLQPTAPTLATSAQTTSDYLTSAGANTSPGGLADLTDDELDSLQADPTGDGISEPLANTVDASDSLTSAPQGTTVDVPDPTTTYSYTTSDGATITVGPDGTITSITNATPSTLNNLLDAAKSIYNSPLMQTLRFVQTGVSLVSTIAKLFTAYKTSQAQQALAAQRAAALAAIPSSIPASQGLGGTNSIFMLGLLALALFAVSDSSTR